MTKNSEKLTPEHMYANEDKSAMANHFANLNEQTHFKSPVRSDSLLSPYNPDVLVRKKGNYSIYEEMTHDEQISVCLQIKKDLVLNSGWDIENGEDGQDDIVQEMKSSLMDDPDCALEENLEEILTGYEFGFSLSEKIFQTMDNNYLTLKAIKARHPNTWRIHSDRHGNIEKYEQITTVGNLDIPSKILIHYVNNRRFQNPYGKSDLRNIYNIWFAKNEILKFLAIFAEKYCSPIPVARYPAAIDKAAREELFKIIQSFMQKTAISIPKDIEIEFLQAGKGGSSNSGDIYIKIIDLFNMLIGRGLFVPDLLGYQGGETKGGAYALGIEQIGIFAKHIQKRRMMLERLVNHHIIQPMCVWNYGLLEKFPKFKLNPIREDDAQKAAGLWVDAMKGRIYKPTAAEINKFRDAIRFPKEDLEKLQEKLDEEQEMNNLLKIKGLEDGANPEGGEGNPPPKKKGTEEEGKGPEDRKNPKGGKKEDKKEKQTFNYMMDQIHSDLPDGFDKRVDYAKLDMRLKNSLSDIVDETSPIIKKMIEDVIDQVAKKKILQNKNIESIDKFKLKGLKDLKQTIKAKLRDHFKNSKQDAFNELIKGNYAEPALPGEEFLALLESETFGFVGDLSKKTLREIRTAAVQAIKDGQSAFVAIADDDIRKSLMISIERYARTKLTEVMNKARFEFFEETGRVQGYQFSAIMDSRTTAICSGLHGKKFKSDNAPIPPMHFNCRSVLVPILMGQEFAADTSVESWNSNEDKYEEVPIENFIKENIGKGFPTK